VRTFCEQVQVNEHSFYNWRARLRKEEPVRFALVEPVTSKPGNEAIDLTLATGERLLIGNRVDPAALRMVLAVLRT
jgi:hypothetical protein